MQHCGHLHWLPTLLFFVLFRTAFGEKGEVSREKTGLSSQKFSYRMYQDCSSVAVLLCSCVYGFICGVSFVIICSSSLLPLVSQEGCASGFPGYNHIHIFSIYISCDSFKPCLLWKKKTAVCCRLGGRGRRKEVPFYDVSRRHLSFP